jgi:hypothetical protein
MHVLNATMQNAYGRPGMTAPETRAGLAAILRG